MPQMAFIADAEGNIIYFNQRWYEFVAGMKNTEGWGWKDKPIHHPDDLQRTIDTWTRSLKTGGPYEIEYRLRRHDGKYIWHLGRAMSIRDQTGKIKYWLGTNTDIHKQKQVENALSRSQNRLRKTNNLLFMARKASALGWLTWDIEKGKVHLDSRGRQILSIAKGNINMEEWIGRIHPDDRPSVSQQLQPTDPENLSFQMTYRIILSEGNVRHIQNNGAFIQSGNGNLPRGTGFIKDITQQKLIQQQKDDFIAIASHELKTPVSVIKGYVQITEEELRNKGLDRYAEHLKKIDGQIRKISTLINELLDITKIDSGRLLFKKIKFDFDQLVGEKIDDMRHITNSKLVFKGTTGKIAIGDPERTGQVIINLISNAVKFSPDNKEVVIEVSSKKNQVLLSVKDKGIGIPPGDMTIIFDRYSKLKTKSNFSTGLGIGLYISAEIIKRQKGEIWVESEEGKGSVFSFSLPAE